MMEGGFRQKSKKYKKKNNYSIHFTENKNELCFYCVSKLLTCFGNNQSIILVSILFLFDVQAHVCTLCSDWLHVVLKQSSSVRLFSGPQQASFYLLHRFVESCGALQSYGVYGAETSEGQLLHQEILDPGVHFKAVEIVSVN